MDLPSWPTGHVAETTTLTIRLDDDPRYRGSVHEDATARAMGFRAALVPGAFLYGHLSRLALDAWGLDWVSRGWMASRFRRPVYNGDAVTILAGAPVRRNGRLEVDLSMRSQDGEVCTGTVGLADGAVAPPDAAAWPLHDAPSERRAIAPGGMVPGLRGATTPAVLGEDDVRRSRAAFDERHPFYDQTGLAHSGCLMRLAMREVNSAFAFPSPVVLTACETQHFRPAPAGCVVAVSSVVADEYERNGRRFFVSDELLLADGHPAARFRRTQVYAHA